MVFTVSAVRYSLGIGRVFRYKTVGLGRLSDLSSGAKKISLFFHKLHHP